MKRSNIHFIVSIKNERDFPTQYFEIPLAHEGDDVELFRKLRETVSRDVDLSQRQIDRSGFPNDTEMSSTGLNSSKYATHRLI